MKFSLDIIRTLVHVCHLWWLGQLFHIPSYPEQINLQKIETSGKILSTLCKLNGIIRGMRIFLWTFIFVIAVLSNIVYDSVNLVLTKQHRCFVILSVAVGMTKFTYCFRSSSYQPGCSFLPEKYVSWSDSVPSLIFQNQVGVILIFYRIAEQISQIVGFTCNDERIIPGLPRIRLFVITFAAYNFGHRGLIWVVNCLFIAVY